MAHGRAGLYAWGGPGTVRILRTKYFSPTIDEHSFQSLYDLDTLKLLQDRLDLTDIWATFSWGYNDANEQVDRKFLIDRLQNVHRLDLKVHAYVQGWNLITEDFPDADFWALDGNAQPMAYSKGRRFTCVNHPEFQKLFLDRVRLAAEHNVDGIFIDNIMFGLPPLFVRQDLLPACGCRCQHCQTAFLKASGQPLPRFEVRGKDQIAEFVAFRCNSTLALLQQAAQIAKDHGKEFGVNLYDPLHHTPELFYGYELQAVSEIVDYLLIENHGLPSNVANNEYLLPLLKSTKKPVFVVSYKQGIGFEPAYSPEDFATIAVESMELGYHPCFKGTEFTTSGVWHAVRPEQLPTVTTQARALTPGKELTPRRLASKQLQDALLAFIARFTAPLMNLASDSPIIGRIVYRLGVPKNVLQSDRSFRYTVAPEKKTLLKTKKNLVTAQ